MHTKKIITAAFAMCLAATALCSTGAVSAAAADSQLTFDIRSGGKNEINISAADIAAGDFTIPVDIYIPENPGVNAVQLKLQINDGEVQKDGSFNNYGLYLSDASLASPYCFDHANEGDASKAFAGNFNASKMNLSWIFSQDTSANADACSEANTTSWTSKTEWAYKNAFAKANLVVPKDTKAGTYTLDIRKDKYVNSLTPDKYVQSACASADSTEALSYRSIPLNVIVEETVQENDWVDSYKIEDGGHYLIIGDVCGAPGETVKVPVYVFGDTGTAGLQVFFAYDKGLTLEKYSFDKENNAYKTAPQANAKSTPATYVIADNAESTAKDGAVLTLLNVTIPADAEEGTLYNINFVEDEESILKVVDLNGNKLNTKFYDGSVTVLSSTTKPTLNRTSVTFNEAGATANLTLFNAHGAVTWTSSDENVAKVDANGFITAVGEGDAVITATTNGEEYICTVQFGGLFGDVDGSGDITNLDAQAALIHYTENLASKPGPLTEAQKKIADVDGDGTVTANDAQHILVYYVQKVVSKRPNVSWRQITGNSNAPE